MNDFVGMICPVCKEAIKEDDAVKVCPDCGTVHHESCWEHNQGCAAPDCLGKNKKPVETANEAPVAPPVVEETVPVQDKICSNCGAPVEQGHDFCPKCGTRVGTPVTAQPINVAAPAAPVTTEAKPLKKKLPLLIGIIAGVAVITVALILLLGGSKKDFRDMYGELEVNSWCTIAADGSYMKLDTNPKDKDSDDFVWTDYELFLEADENIERINKELGFSDALYEKMGTTTWSQGRQTDSNSKYTVTWTYHPDKGLEVLYEFKR